jgi:hypothetical protein
LECDRNPFILLRRQISSPPVLFDSENEEAGDKYAKSERYFESEVKFVEFVVFHVTQ